MVAESGGIEVPAFAVGVCLGNPAAWGADVAGVTAGIRHTREKQVLRVILGDRVNFWLGRLGVITPEDHERFSIGGEDHRVGAMFAPTL
ncbi:MAG: hypothetical protein CMP30_10945 [Roseibacillus sp.]|nr:hypothetical protein [Roseibacillus sp.]